MPQRNMTHQIGKFFTAKDITDKPTATESTNQFSVRSGDASAFLTTMLKRM